MPTLAVPHVEPSSVHFFIDEGQGKSSRDICILNPFSYDVLFKVDINSSQKLAVSLKQGIISSRQKLFIKLSSTTTEPCHEEVQFRFFKWAKPRRGQKHQASKYLGFRLINITICMSREELERTTCDQGSVSASVSSSYQSPTTLLDSLTPPTHNNGSTQDNSKKRHVTSRLVLALFLTLCGFILTMSSEEWFSSHIVEGVKPQNLAIISYTLAAVVFLQLLTFS